jgi:S-adenosylmethionine:tRNA-ribosyltransferase-isomerase (queuine synthetase)
MNSSKALASLIEKSNGKMVTVTFVKNDGSVRVLNGRMGVKKYIKGSSLKKNSTEYITIYDVKNEGYRSVNRDTIVAVRCNGIEAVAVK